MALVLAAQDHTTEGHKMKHLTDTIRAAMERIADLEAENQRLREALENIKHLKTFAIETTSSWCPLATEMVELARAALKEQP